MIDNNFLRVAVAQIAVGTQIDDNLAKILETINQCAERGAQLVLFPETALTGYSPAIGRNRSPNEWPAIENALDQIASKAGELCLATVVGSEIWDGEAWRNRALAYDELGQLAAIYDKAHLMRADMPHYAPGAEPTIWEWRGLRIGLLICYDVRFPEPYRQLLAQDVQIILQGFYAAGGATWKVPVMGAHVIGRAAETGCFIVTANVGNPQQMMRSLIVDPLGLVLAESTADAEQLLVADLDMSRIQNSEIRDDYVTRFAERDAAR